VAPILQPQVPTLSCRAKSIIVKLRIPNGVDEEEQTLHPWVRKLEDFDRDSSLPHHEIRRRVAFTFYT